MDCNLKPELILLSVRAGALDEYVSPARDNVMPCNKKLKLSDWSLFGLFGKYRTRFFQRFLQQGKQLFRRIERRSNPVPRQQMCQSFNWALKFPWAQRRQGSIWESAGEVRDGAGKRVMECELCTENDREGIPSGGAGKGSALAVKVTAAYIQRCRTWPGMY
jgi:hypothetical protein